MLETRSTVRRLAKIASYAETHSLRETAIRFNITSPEGQPSTGLVAHIKRGWVPHTPSCRQRCGLLPRRRMRILRPVTINQLMQLPISEQPTEILRLAFENREEMP